MYALLGTLVSILVEAWNQFIKQRGVFLQKSILRMLEDPLNVNLGYLIYQHPTINRMRKDNNNYLHHITDGEKRVATLDQQTGSNTIYHYQYES